MEKNTVATKQPPHLKITRQMLFRIFGSTVPRMLTIRIPLSDEATEPLPSPPQLPAPKAEPHVSKKMPYVKGRRADLVLFPRDGDSNRFARLARRSLERKGIKVLTE